MPTLTEALHPCAPIVSEAPGHLSRSVAVIPAGIEVRVGMVLGKLTDGTGQVPLAPAANDGSQKAASVALYPLAAAAGARRITVLDMDAEVRASDLEWPAGIADADKATAVAQLLSLGIKLR